MGAASKDNILLLEYVREKAIHPFGDGATEAMRPGCDQGVEERALKESSDMMKEILP